MVGNLDKKIQYTIIRSNYTFILLILPISHLFQLFSDNNPENLEKTFCYTIKLISFYVYNFNAFYFTLVQTLSRKSSWKFWENISIHNYSF